jgi:hypothetical protein
VRGLRICENSTWSTATSSLPTYLYRTAFTKSRILDWRRRRMCIRAYSNNWVMQQPGSDGSSDLHVPADTI